MDAASMILTFTIKDLRDKIDQLTRQLAEEKQVNGVALNIIKNLEKRESNITRQLVKANEYKKYAGNEYAVLQKQFAEAREEIARLRKAQVVTINTPPMPDSELIGYLQDFNNGLKHEINRLREYIMKLEASDG